MWRSNIVIVAHQELRNARLTDKLVIQVDGQRIEETTSEKLLGIVVNNKLSWKEHLYRDKDNPGLISQLKLGLCVVRAGLLSIHRLMALTDVTANLLSL